MTVTRKKKIIYISISGVLVILGALYTGFPWLLTQLIRSQLADRGMRDIQVQVDYPGMSQVMVQSLSFHGPVAEGDIKVEIPKITVNYQLMGLVAGQLQSVQIPDVNIQMQLPATQSGKQTKQPTVAVPIGFLSGQWLAEVPVEELMLDRLQLEAGTASSRVYRVRLNAQLRFKHLQLVGELSLPQLTAPLTFLAGAGQTGQAHVHLVSGVEGEPPLLAIEVRPPDNNQPSVLKGELHTQFDRLLPVMTPVLSSFYPSLRSAAGLKGELNSQWQVNVVNDQWQLKGKANIASLSGQWGELTIPHSEWQASYQLVANQFESQSTLKSFQQKVRVDLLTQHDTDTGQGQTSFKLVPVEFDNDTMRLANFVKDWAWPRDLPWDLPIDVTQGQVSASGTVDWNKRLDVKGQLQLNGLGGHYNEMSFEGIQATMDLAYEDGIQTLKPVPLTVESVNVGFPIKDVSMTFALSPKPKQGLPVVTVKQFEAFMLGGRAYSGPFDYDFYREKNTFEVQLEGLAVHELMELERQEGLAGDGFLDGSLPIEITDHKVIIKEGTLSARKPGGTIQYKPTDKVAALAKSNTGVDLIVKALSNFKYDVLDVKTNYLPGGDLHLKVRIQGSNPEWQEGQPINLNLNLQENIPALLRSLQLSSEISEKVRKRVEEKSDTAR